MYCIDIDIKANSLEDARELIEEIARDVENDKFGAACTKEMQEQYGGSVFVTESN